MTAIGKDRFQRMLVQLGEKARRREVRWIRDDDEKTLNVELADQFRISLYHHLPPESDEIVGAVLRSGAEIVVTLEAEPGDDHWNLLHDLVHEAEGYLDQDDREIEEIERQLNADAPLGEPSSEGSAVTPAAPSKEVLPSMEDLVDGDSPLDEQS